MKLPRFFFESNKFFDFIDSMEDWQRLRNAYPTMDDAELLSAKEATFKGTVPEEVRQSWPNFGFRLEHDGVKTLKDFFISHGVSLPSNTRSHMYTPDSDLSSIFNYFDNCPGDILEIGCNAGVTTRKLAERYPDRTIYGVDSAQSYLTMHPSQHGETPEHPGALAANLPNVHILEGLPPLILNSHRPQLTTVTCVFIDGDHSFAGVMADTYWILGFLPATNNVIIWHDYYKGCPNWCRVNQVVDSIGERFNVINPLNTHLAVLSR